MTQFNENPELDESTRIDDILSKFVDRLQQTNSDTADELQKLDEKRTNADIARMRETISALDAIKESFNSSSELFDSLVENSNENSRDFDILKGIMRDATSIFKELNVTNSQELAATFQWSKQVISQLENLDIQNSETNEFVSRMVDQLKSLNKTTLDQLNLENFDLQNRLRQENLNRSKDLNDDKGGFLGKIFSWAKILVPLVGSLLFASKYFDGTGKWFEPIKKFLSDISGPFFNLVKVASGEIKRILPTLTEFWTKALPIISTVLGGIMDAFSLILPITVTFNEYMLKFATQFLETPHFMSAAVQASINILSTAANLLKAPFIKFGEYISGFTRSISKTFNWIIKTLDYVGGIGSKILSFGSKFVGFASKIFKFFKFLGWPMQIILSILDFIKGFSETDGDFLDKFVGGVKAVWDGLIEIPMMIFDWLMNLDIMKKLGASLSNIWKNVTDWWAGLDILGSIKGFFGSIWDSITGLFGNVMDSVVQLIKQHPLVKAVNGLIDYFTNDEDKRGFLERLVDLPKALLTGMLNWIKDIDLPFGMGSAVGKAMDWIASKFGIDLKQKPTEPLKVSQTSMPLNPAMQRQVDALNQVNADKINIARDAKEGKVLLLQQNAELQKTNADTLVKLVESQKEASKNQSELVTKIAQLNVSEPGSGQSRQNLSIPVGPDQLATLSRNYWRP